MILHSDQGVQFTSWDFVNFCKDNNVTSFSSVEMMDELTMNYINWYNYVRPHSYNDYLTPMEVRYR